MKPIHSLRFALLPLAMAIASSASATILNDGTLHVITPENQSTIATNAYLGVYGLADGSARTTLQLSDNVAIKIDNQNASTGAFTLYQRYDSNLIVDKGSSLTMYGSLSGQPAFVSNMEISGTVKFIQNSSIFSAGLKNYDSTLTKSGTIVIKNGGSLGSYYGTSVDTIVNTNRWDLRNTSVLKVEAGGKAYVQTILLSNNATVDLAGTLFQSTSATDTTASYIAIMAQTTVGERVKLKFADNYTLNDGKIIFQDNANFDMVFAATKAADSQFTFNGFRAYSKVGDNNANLRLYNFTNDYMFMTDPSTISISEGGIITIVKNSSSNDDLNLLITAYAGEDGTGFSTGWYLENVYDSEDKLLGCYLNNSNFPIPEPSTYAAIFGALALAYCAAKKRN